MVYLTTSSSSLHASRIIVIAVGYTKMYLVSTHLKKAKQQTINTTQWIKCHSLIFLPTKYNEGSQLSNETKIMSVLDPFFAYAYHFLPFSFFVAVGYSCVHVVVVIFSFFPDYIDIFYCSYFYYTHTHTLYSTVLLLCLTYYHRLLHAVITGPPS